MKDVKFEYVSRLSESTISLPQKGSKHAAGYDFFNPADVTIEPHKIEYVKTGVKAKFPDDLALLLLNRSSNPKKKGLVLANGIGLIDADYYNNEDNEGEIAFAFMNISDEPVTIKEGDKLGQGMFVAFIDTEDYNELDINERKGGFGSTGI